MPNGHLWDKATILMLPACRSLCRLLASLLLALTIATPAVAEIACADDALMHVSDSVMADQAAGAELPDDGDEPALPDQAGHCAFNHGHCNAIAAVPAAASSRFPIQVAFAQLAPPRLARIAPAGPERPPQS